MSDIKEKTKKPVTLKINGQEVQGHIVYGDTTKAGHSVVELDEAAHLQLKEITGGETRLSDVSMEVTVERTVLHAEEFDKLFEQEIETLNRELREAGPEQEVVVDEDAP